MSPELIGIIGFCVMLLLMFLGIPLGIAMTLVGLVGFALITGPDAALQLGGIIVPSTFEDYSFTVIPIFLLMGEFADISGMMRDAYKTANVWLGNLPGGLAMASIIGAGAFSAVSGSSMACAVIMTRVALPSLLDHKYSPTLAVGTLASGGTLGNLVPPGVLLVVYALLAEASIGKIMIGAIIPGALLAVMYVVQIYIQCRIKPEMGPRAGATTWKEKLDSTKYAVPLVAVFALVMGGILFGMFTPFEAAAVGTLIVFVYAVIRRTVNGHTFATSLINTLLTTGMVIAIIIGARVFTSFIALSGLSQAMAEWVLGLSLPPVVIVIVIMLTYFIIGTAMDTLAMLLLTLPIFIVIVRALGIDLVWFGILVIVQMELSNISPPVGMYLFAVAGMVKDRGITMGTVFKGVMPFCLTCLVFNAILIAFPQITLFLPSFMGK